MESYQIEIGEETEETKLVHVTLFGKPFATATYYKGKMNSDIRISESADREAFEMDREFVKMSKDIKSLLFRFHEEDLRKTKEGTSS